MSTPDQQLSNKRRNDDDATTTSKKKTLDDNEKPPTESNSSSSAPTGSTTNVASPSTPTHSNPNHNNSSSSINAISSPLNIPNSPNPNNSSNNNNTQQTISLKMLISCREVGNIIGKSGCNVKRMREETGARISISDLVPGAPNRIVLVTGTPQSVSLVFQHIRKLKDSSQVTVEFDMKFPIAKSQVGCIIGKGGVRINEIREQSGAHISISQTVLPDSTERVLSLAGDADAVQKAVYAICCELLQNPPKGVSIPYKPQPLGGQPPTGVVGHHQGQLQHVGQQGGQGQQSVVQQQQQQQQQVGISNNGSPHHHQGMGFGPAGHYGGPHQRSSSSSIFNSPGNMSSPQSNTNSNTFSGPSSPSFGTVVQQATSPRGSYSGGAGIVSSNNNNNSSTSSGSTRGMPMGMNISPFSYQQDQPYMEQYQYPPFLGHPFGPPQVSQSHQLILSVPNEKAGLIIGRNGHKIKEIRQNSGAQVRVSEIPMNSASSSSSSSSGSPGSPQQSSSRTITISGTHDAVQTAHYLINQCLM